MLPVQLHYQDKRTSSHHLLQISSSASPFLPIHSWRLLCLLERTFRQMQCTNGDGGMAKLKLLFKVTMHCRKLLSMRLEAFTGHPGRWQLSSFQLQLVLIQLQSIFSFKNLSEINIDFYTDIETQYHVPNTHLHCLILNP